MGETIRLGLLRLCDAAPVILAYQEEMYAARGLHVELSIEPSWANIADKLSFGLLEAAVMLPPLAMACAAGLRGPKTELVVPMSLSANGDAVTLAVRHAERFATGGLVGAAAGQHLRLAVVHGFSTHDLLLRDWLAKAGIDPARDVEITVLPPSEMSGGLQAGVIDGFCAGAPWGEVAAQERAGFIAVRSRDIRPDHPEKCLALRADFCGRDPAGVKTLVRVLREASLLCAVPERRVALAQLLSAPGYLDLPADLIATGLDPATGGPVFTAQYPSAVQALWYAEQLLRWGKAPASILAMPALLYRPDIFEGAGTL